MPVNRSSSFHERVPRLDYSAGFFIAALLSCAGLLACRALQLPDWRTPT